MKTIYIGNTDISDLQEDIMRFCTRWVKEMKTPVPRSEIVIYLEEKGVNMPTTRAAIYSLVKKGYIREAITISNKTSYVQLRTI